MAKRKNRDAQKARRRARKRQAGSAALSVPQTPEWWVARLLGEHDLLELDLSLSGGLPEPAKAIRTILAIGRNRILKSRDPEDVTLFLHPDDRESLLAAGEVIKARDEKDPGYFAWFMDCDMLSVPDWGRLELLRLFYEHDLGCGWVP